MNWLEIHNGSRSGRYTITLGGPHQWRLSIRGRPHSLHRTLSAARIAAERVERLRRRRSSIFRRAGVLVAATLALVFILPLRSETNPAHAPAAELASGMQAAFDDITSGGAETGDFDLSTSAFSGAVVPGSQGDLQVLIGTSNSRCYVMYWGPGEIPRAGVLVPSLECRPEAVLGTSLQANYLRFTPRYTFHLQNAPASFNWDHVLPPPTRLPRWYYPVVIGLALLMLRVLVSVSVVRHADSRARDRDPSPGAAGGALLGASA